MNTRYKIIIFSCNLASLLAAIFVLFAVGDAHTGSGIFSGFSLLSNTGVNVILFGAILIALLMVIAMIFTKSL